MPGETLTHRTLKKEACYWLYASGYRCVAAEVALRPLGIIDAVGAGVFHYATGFPNRRKQVHHTCFIECKASRADYLRDLSPDGQLQLCLMERRANTRGRGRARRRLRQTVGLGKFDACLLLPMANLHYVLAPAGLIKKSELPPRWGLLSHGAGGISVVVKAQWQNTDCGAFVESAIARTLTNGIYRAGERAMMSLNRQMQQQQDQLAKKIKSLSSVIDTPASSKAFDTQSTMPLPSGSGWAEDDD